jgi:hypothetical protein
LAPLAVDLAAWRLASGRPDGDQLVFPKRGGGLWRDHDWANWRRQVFGPLAATVGARGMHPYDLRHAFCSLLIAEGLSVVEVARQAGHAPTMTLGTYAHVMADHDGADQRTAEAAIRTAREAEVSGTCPPEGPGAPRPGETPVFPESPPSDSNRKPLHYKRHRGSKRSMVRGHDRHGFARPVGVSR